MNRVEFDGISKMHVVHDARKTTRTLKGVRKSTHGLGSCTRYYMIIADSHSSIIHEEGCMHTMVIILVRVCKRDFMMVRCDGALTWSGELRVAELERKIKWCRSM